MGKPTFCTKVQISFAVTEKLISAYVFATVIVQPLYFLIQNFKLLHVYSVTVQPGLYQTWSEITMLVFQHSGSNIRVKVLHRLKQKQ